VYEVGVFEEILGCFLSTVVEYASEGDWIFDWFLELLHSGIYIHGYGNLEYTF